MPAIESAVTFREPFSLLEMLPEGLKLGHLPVDLGEMGVANGRHALAGSPSRAAEALNFARLFQRQPQPLRASNESELV